MSLLDAYNTFTSDSCQNLSKQNSIFESLSQGIGLTQITEGLGDLLSGDIAEKLLNSPLRDMAEDIVSREILKATRQFSQTILGLIPDNITNTLQDLRSVAFSSVFTALTLKQNMSMYFASGIAQDCVNMIREKRYTLICLQEAVRKLNNAILALSGGPPIFNEYLEKLREALIYIHKAHIKLTAVQANILYNDNFLTAIFEQAKDELDTAYELMAPQSKGTSGNILNESFLHEIVSGLDFEKQLAQLMMIPNLAKELLGQYDLYALKTLKVNTYLLGFQSAIQDLEAVGFGRYKDTIMTQVDNARVNLQDIIASMAININGSEGAIHYPEPDFKPNPTITSSRSILWSTRVKATRVLLDVLDPEALQHVNNSNDALAHYTRAILALEELNDLTTDVAILRATAGREEVGGIEGDILTFVFQANQALLDSSLTVTTNGSFDSNTVIALGIKLYSRMGLSIRRDKEIEYILLGFIASVKTTVGPLKNFGDSIFSLLDDLGMDRAFDFLKQGKFQDFFNMSGRTLTYLGAAIEGLSLLQELVGTEQQRECVARAMNRLQVADTANKLSTERQVSYNYTRQQQQNERKCEQLKVENIRIKGCTAGVDTSLLVDNPHKSLQGLLRGVFGGDFAESMPGSFGELGEIVNTTGARGIVSDMDQLLGKNSGIFSSVEFAAKAAQDAVESAQEAVASAKESLATAIADATKYVEDSLKGVAKTVTSESPSPSDITGTVSDEQKQAETLLKSDKLPLKVRVQLEQAFAAGDVAKSMQTEADKLLANQEHVKSAFNKVGEA